MSNIDSNQFNVNLSTYSGPLDVLLDLAKSQKVNLENISVTKLADQSKRSQTLALRWLLDSARKRKNKTMSEKLINELIDAFQKKGSAIKKREDTHRMAESNKAFAHFRW